MFKKICRHCGKEFFSDGPTKAYCSVKCRKEHLKEAKKEKLSRLSDGFKAKKGKMYYVRNKMSQSHAKCTNGFESVMGLSRETLDYVSSVFPKFDVSKEEKARYI